MLGGGNSAGQAAVYLSRFARHVTVLIRRHGLAETMSDYLVRELASAGNVTIRPRVQVVGGSGERVLHDLVLENLDDGSRTTVRGRRAVRDDRFDPAHRLPRRGGHSRSMGLHPDRIPSWPPSSPSRGRARLP